jgi:activator of HSP90 ATPase
MKTIKHSYTLNATPTQVYGALTDPKVIEQWSGAPAQMETTSNGAFSLFGGQVTGTNLEIVPDKKLVQSWPSNTKVTLTLKGNGQETVVDLLHEDIPDSEEAKFEQGWKEYYFGPLQKMFAA